MKYTFKAEEIIDGYNNNPARTITIETDNVTVTDLLDDFKDFLLGCGFHPSTVAKINAEGEE